MATDLLGQLVVLTRQHLPQYANYADAAVRDVFLDALREEQIAVVSRGGQVQGFVTWAWIRRQEDIASWFLELPTTGPVLFVVDVVATAPGVLWALKRRLPTHRWLAGLHENRVHAPKGWPQEESTYGRGCEGLQRTG